MLSLRDSLPPLAFPSGIITGRMLAKTIKSFSGFFRSGSPVHLQTKLQTRKQHADGGHFSKNDKLFNHHLLME